MLVHAQPPTSALARKQETAFECHTSREEPPAEETPHREGPLAWDPRLRERRTSGMVPVRPERGTSSNRQQPQVSKTRPRRRHEPAVENHVLCRQHKVSQTRGRERGAERRLRRHQEQGRGPRRGLSNHSLGSLRRLARNRVDVPERAVRDRGPSRREQRRSAKDRLTCDRRVSRQHPSASSDNLGDLRRPAPRGSGRSMLWRNEQGRSRLQTRPGPASLFPAAGYPAPG